MQTSSFQQKLVHKHGEVIDNQTWKCMKMQYKKCRCLRDAFSLSKNEMSLAKTKARVPGVEAGDPARLHDVLHRVHLGHADVKNDWARGQIKDSRSSIYDVNNVDSRRKIDKKTTSVIRASGLRATIPLKRLSLSNCSASFMFSKGLMTITLHHLCSCMMLIISDVAIQFH